MNDKLAWLALRDVPGVGPVLFHRLLQACGSPARVFQASLPELIAVRGVSPALAQAILAFRAWDRVEADLSRLRAFGGEILTLDDPRYPARLQEIPFPPPLIFVKGEIRPEDGLALALVGTRAASYYGLKVCRQLARELARRGVTVVSGLARGIDTAAHQGALEEGGRTLAVLGCGLDVVYPPENRELYGRIAEQGQGALVTEFPLGTPPEAKNFPRRNRLISGLALGVLVVEAGVKSGANITAQCALEQGREVLAVPGPILAPTSQGPHRLIQQGAKLVMDVEDIMGELPREGVAAPTAPAKGHSVSPRPLVFRVDDPLLPFLGVEPLQLEELVQASRLSAPEVMSRLTLLELQGLVRELPGKCYVLG
jgi:DNA processing protein